MNDRTGSRPSRTIWRLLGRVLDKFEKWTVVLFLFGIVALIFSGVLSRYVFHYSLAFSEELARFIFVWGALLGASSAYRTGEHAGIPLIANRFGPRGRRAIEIFVALGVLTFLDVGGEISCIDFAVVDTGTPPP